MIVWVREEEVLSQVEEVFRSLKIPESILNRVIEYVRKTNKTERDFMKRQIGDLNRDYAKLQNRLDTLMDLLLDGLIDREEFETKRTNLRQAQIETEELIKPHNFFITCHLNYIRKVTKLRVMEKTKSIPQLKMA